jgi:hypothetical protein
MIDEAVTGFVREEEGKPWYGRSRMVMKALGIVAGAV